MQLAASKEDLAEEERRVRYLSRFTDMVCAFLAQGELSVLEACRLMQMARQEAIRLFPDKAAVYDLIYQPRFSRLVAQHILNSSEWTN